MKRIIKNCELCDRKTETCGSLKMRYIYPFGMVKICKNCEDKWIQRQ